MQVTDVPMAPPVEGAVWPVAFDGLSFNQRAHAMLPPSLGCRFGDPREGGRRRTIGVTLWSTEVSPIVAPVACEFVAICPWEPQLWIVYLATQTCFIGLGGVAYGTVPKEARHGHLVAGTVVARTGVADHHVPRASVHVSMYARPPGCTPGDFMGRVRQGEFVWRGEPSPLLLNPTAFLEGIRHFVSAGQKIPIVQSGLPGPKVET